MAHEASLFNPENCSRSSNLNPPLDDFSKRTPNSVPAYFKNPFQEKNFSNNEKNNSGSTVKYATVKDNINSDAVKLRLRSEIPHLTRKQVTQ